ncbi:MAG: gluconokinase [Caulobacterales bacterium]|nr:gluconokinase [Caulobacterales bacterium]
MTGPSAPALFVLMGVTGAGKTTIGARVCAALGWPFYEGDDFHPPANIAKMTGGTALANADRDAWIAAIAARINQDRPAAAILACSALNETVRGWLRARLALTPAYILLEADRDALARRSAARAGHFMSPALLDSQLQALEPPPDVVRIRSDEPVDAVAAAVIAAVTALRAGAP